MKRHKRHSLRSKIVLISLAAVLLIGAGAMALTAPEIPRYTVGAGGVSSGGDYTLTGSIGQHDAGGVMRGGNYTMSGGFLAGLGETITDFLVHLPLVIK
jgi:hypothetical protein